MNAADLTVWEDMRRRRTKPPCPTCGQTCHRYMAPSSRKARRLARRGKAHYPKGGSGFRSQLIAGSAPGWLFGKLEGDYGDLTEPYRETLERIAAKLSLTDG